MNQRDTLKINDKGCLEVGGMDAVKIAQQFGTPVYVFDEAQIRKMMRTFKGAIENNYGGNGLVLYASKAFACLAIYAISEHEGVGVDVVSGGELYTALNAGVSPDKIFMHGNNKLYSELELAVKNNVGYIVLDSLSEADILDGIAEKYNTVQKVLIRVNPGIEAHTHEFIQTARTDSKFGFSVSDGSAENITEYVLGKTHLKLKGYHCHIGSQIFEKHSFSLAAEKMMDFIAKIKSSFKYESEILNLGGGFGIWYNDSDPKLTQDDYTEYVKSIAEAVKTKCGKLNLKQPFLVIEPGRSIVGEAGITLYTVGVVKDIPGIKKYVAVDGGMFENPRYALYQSKYTAVVADRADADCTEKVTIAGKCCESGDILAADVALPKVNSGDILAVLSTGAYNYSMASNYNRNFVPPVVFVNEGKADVVVKPQTYEDLIRNDVIPERLKDEFCDK